jgi:hypothetical protein
LGLLERGCELGDADGCFGVAMALRSKPSAAPDGPGVAAALRKATVLYDEDCGRAVAKSCTSAGFLYLRGPDVTSAQEGMRRLERGCALGDWIACTAGANRYRKGDGVPRDLTRAARLHGRACERHGSASDCCFAGTLQLDPSSESASQPALTYLARACEAGAIQACVTAWALGHGASGALQEAAQAVARACDWPSKGADCSDPCSPLPSRAAPLDRGFGHLTRLCDGGDAKACYLAGLTLTQGVGARRDLPAGVSRLKQACDGRLLMACARLAEAYWFGLGVAENRAEARRLAATTCQAGFQPACTLLPRSDSTPPSR